MEFNRKGFVKFTSALLASVLVLTFLPLNALSVFAEGEEEKPKYGYKKDGMYTIVVTEKVGDTHKVDYRFYGSDRNGQPYYAEDDIIDVYDNPVKNAYVSIKGNSNCSDFSAEGYTDDDGMFKVDFASYYLKHLENGEWSVDFTFDLTIKKEGTGYQTINKTINPNTSREWDGVYYYESYPIECTDLSDNFEKLAGISELGYKEIAYDGESHKASEVGLFSLNNGLEVEYTTDDEPSFLDVGGYDFDANFSGEGYYDFNNNKTYHPYSFHVEVIQGERSSFAFPEPKEIEIDYVDGEDNVYQLPTPTCNDEEEPKTPIEYDIPDEYKEIASVSDTGLVEFNKPGTVKVTATMPEGDNYTESYDYFTVTALKRAKVEFSPKFVNAVYNIDKTYEQTATITDGFDKTKIRYSIVTEGTTADASVDDKSGLVTINSGGNIVVKASFDDTDCYHSEDTYTIKVALAQREVAIPTTQVFYYELKTPIFTDDCNPELPDTLEYIVTNDEGEEIFDAVELVKESGKWYLHVKNAKKKFNLHITVPADTKFDDFVLDISSTTVTIDQTIALTKERYDSKDDGHLNTGTKLGHIYFTGAYSGTYSVNRELSDPRVYDVEFGYGVIRVWMKERIDDPTSIYVVIDIKGDNNHNDTQLKATLLIGYKEDIDTTVLYNGEPAKTGYYNKSVEIKPQDQNVQIQNENGDKAPSYTLKDDGIHAARENNVLFYQTVDGTDYTNLGSVAEIKIDKTAPSFSIDITDPNNDPDDKNDDIVHILLKDGVYGIFAQNALTVTVTATDNGSGVSAIKYGLASFSDKDNAKDVNYIISGEEQSGKQLVGAFTIPANSDEKIRVWVYDEAGNVAYTIGSTGNFHHSDNILINGKQIIDENNKPIPSNTPIKVVTDDIDPIVTVYVKDIVDDSDENNKNKNVESDDESIYFNVNREATIEIIEKNYSSDKVKISVTRNGNEVSDSELERVDSSYINNENETVHKIELKFKGDGEYIFSVECKDNSGNIGKPVYNGKAAQHFIIDTLDPEVEVKYNDDSETVKHNNEYYSTGRIATITINELNYSYEGLTVKVDMKRGLNDSFVEAKPGEGDVEGDYVINTDKAKSGIVTLEFTKDAEYKVSVSYVDLAKNPANVTSYSEENPGYFVIDTKDPQVKVVYTDEGVHNEKYFNSDRTANITFTERNFTRENAILSVNGKYVDLDWVDDDPKNPDVHKASFIFNEEKDYKIAVYCTDKADRSCSNVDYGTIAPQEFTVDKSKPTKLTMTINGDSVASTDTSIVFDKFYNKPVTVFLSADCSNSGEDSLQYQLADKSSNFNATASWYDYDKATGILINTGSKVVVYFKATDKASNSEIIHSTGIVVDNQAPEGEQNAPEIDIIPAAPNSRGFYNGNVSVKLTVNDPAYIGDTRDATGSFSGLKRVTYTIYTTDTDAVESGTLLNLAVDKDYPSIIGDSNVSDFVDKLARAWTDSITINAEKFNSNNVIVEVTAEDNAGNIRISKTSAGNIKIDVSKPSIDISYNNNTADEDNCFKEDRVATIVITERNFSPDDVRVSITTSTGALPEVNGWTKTNGSGNGDNTRWTTTIPYTRDADYTFDIAYADLAGNVADSISYGNSVAPKGFTIDKTVPTINVSYDNNTAVNNIYYNAKRTATITIVEHNFDAGRVNITLKATDDGANITIPAVSNWSNNGDTHTATIAYDKDGRYVFDITVKDKAGNDAADFAEQTFYVDTTVPVLKITGVTDKSANSGSVTPVITYSDTNYSEDRVFVSFSGANRGKLALDGTYSDIHNGKTFKFNDFAMQKDMDDIYTLEVTIIDLAGNESTQKLTFSINRFGSTYDISDAAKKINGTYAQTPIDIVFTEINPNELVDKSVTVFKNNESLKLVEGVDYDVQTVGGNGKWYEYKYTIHSDVFADDGVYRVSFYSRDEAGNVSENTLDTKNSSLQFGIDATRPNIVVTNLSSNKTYAEKLYTVRLMVTDNLLLNDVEIYLDDFNTPYVSWSAEQVAEIINRNGEFTFDISDYSNSAHKVKIVGTDAAGNVQEFEITNFYVTTNLFVRFITNTPLVIGSIIGLLVLVALVVFIVVMKRRLKYKK